MKQTHSKLRLLALVTLVALVAVVAFGQVKKTAKLKTGQPAAKAPKLKLESLEYNFGQVKEGEVIKHIFTVKNDGVAELIIHNVAPSCECTTANEFPKSLAPGQEGKIALSINTKGISGKTLRTADIFSNDPLQPKVQLMLKLDAVKTEEKKMPEKTVLDFSLNNIDGKATKLSEYRGKVLLLVNVASKCGYTPQYDGLQAIYTKYKDQGLVILGFPANNFMGQEPGTNEEIKTFCQTKFNVSFPLFAKISVKGDDIHPLYQFLTSKETNPEFAGNITWNFNKFLVGQNGKVIARFDTKEKPEGEKIMQAIEAALKK